MDDAERVAWVVTLQELGDGSGLSRPMQFNWDTETWEARDGDTR